MTVQGIAESSRFLSLATPLGPNKLILRSLTGEEEISKLFRFQLDLVSSDHNISFDKVIGQPITVSLVPLDGAAVQHFNG